MIITALFSIAKNQKASDHPSADECNTENGMLFSIKK
jgi:hypothetical protein